MDTYGRQPLDFPTRVELVAFVAAGGLTGLWQGRTVSAQGVEYLVQVGSTSIPDLPGLILSPQAENFRANLLGTVSQVAGVPTGSAIERGTNGNGDYVRFADGTQICWRSGLNVTNASTASGSIFRSSTNSTWTFPVAFIAAPSVAVDCDNADAWAAIAAAPTTTSVAVRAFSGISIATTIPLRLSAVGYWF